MSVSSTLYDIARNFTIYLARTFGSIYFGSIYCFDLYISTSTSLIDASILCIYHFITIPLLYRDVNELSYVDNLL